MAHVTYFKQPSQTKKRKRKIQKPAPHFVEQIRSKTNDVQSKPDIKFNRTREVKMENPNLLSASTPKALGFESNGYQNVQRGDYLCSKGVMYFRSKWEANYALYLDFLMKRGEIKDWQYEKDVFVFSKIQFGTRCYRPDFKVFTNDGQFEYHEVKGRMDGRSATKLKRMAKYYPGVKLILIDAPVYNDIKKKLGNLLRFY